MTKSNQHHTNPYTVKHTVFKNTIIIIGFGSVGRSLVPLIQRHIIIDEKPIIIIEPNYISDHLLNEYKLTHIKEAVNKTNYSELLSQHINAGDFVVNLAVDVCSLDLVKWCRANRALYIDAGTDPWDDYYFSSRSSSTNRSNYYLRELMLKEKISYSLPLPTAVSCCGANPGMVSWLLKEALVELAQDLKIQYSSPNDRNEWAKLMYKIGVKGIHISERDTQDYKSSHDQDTFYNTWSIDGLLAEGLQPAELGWGTHESWHPTNAIFHNFGCKSAILINQPGISTRVRTWCPSTGPQIGYLITHNESISIADYYTIENESNLTYRPTVHYAYRPCDLTLLSLHETLGKGYLPTKKHVLGPEDIASGYDELGVLIYGHNRGALWYGSHLSIDEAVRLAPLQNATGLQVSSAMLAGIIWAIENPNRGIVEADEMDYKRCLEIQRPYLGNIIKMYTNWTPSTSNWGILFPDTIDDSDPWLFRNFLV